MNFKDKIIAAIKAKFPDVNLSKKRLDAIADKIQEKVIDDETKIDAAIDTFNDYNSIKEIAKQDDLYRGLEKKVKEMGTSKTDKGTEKPEEKKAEEAPDDGTPPWAKAILDSNKALNERLGKLESGKTAETILSQATTKLKDIPASYWSKRKLPEKEEDLETFVTEVTTDYAAFTKDLTEKGLATHPTSVGGSGGTGADGKGGEKATKEEIAEITKSIM